ncbi:unnamed protein product [Camellia sinensis]
MRRKGTGKSLLMERVKDSLVDWAQGAGFQPPDALAINCTSLTNTSEIFNTWKKSTPEENRKFYFTIKASSEFVLAKAAINWPEDDRIANAIDLADRFLPRLQSLNCTSVHCLSTASPGTLCQKSCSCIWRYEESSVHLQRSAIEMLQAELRESACNLDFSLAENGYSNQQTTPACDLIKQGIDIVRVDHMAIALSKTYRSPIMDTVQSLPQHQQIMLCSAVKLFRGGKKDTTRGEGLLKLGQSREDKLRRVTLKVDEADVAFALQ